jgi:hypothetical protein
MKIPVSLTEYGIFNWPKGLEGWRFYRIEYGGCNEFCLEEQTIWLPPNADPQDLEKLFKKWQSKSRMGRR